MTTQKRRPPRAPSRDGSKRRVRRPSAPPETGWDLGAGGLTWASWATLAVLLAALAVLLLVAGYIGYGAMILILAAAAAVNLF